jgi:hypothetical protein
MEGMLSMKNKNIILSLVALFLAACTSTPAYIPTEVLVPTNTPLPPSPTFRIEPTLTATSTSTIAPSATSIIPTLPILSTPVPNLVEGFSGTYKLYSWGGDICTVQIKRDATFKTEFINQYNGISSIGDGTIDFADGRFFLNYVNLENDGSPRFCFPKAFILVNWEERKYLLIDEYSAYIISNFCTSVKSGTDLQDVIFYFYRESDLSNDIFGSPVYPDGQLICP